MKITVLGVCLRGNKQYCFYNYQLIKNKICAQNYKKLIETEIKDCKHFEFETLHTESLNFDYSILILNAMKYYSKQLSNNSAP